MPTTDSTVTVKRLHGHTTKTFQSHTYKCWAGMKQRCFNPKNVAFHYYGGRGITVCEQWIPFAGFLKDMGTAPSALHTIERIDNGGNYEPANCKWATKKEQQRNRRDSKFIAFKEQSKTLAEWSEVLGIKKSRLRKRLNAGWNVEKAFTTPFTPRQDRWKMRKNAQPKDYEPTLT